MNMNELTHIATVLTLDLHAMLSALLHQLAEEVAISVPIKQFTNHSTK